MKKLFLSASVFLNVAFFIIACSKKDMQTPLRDSQAGTVANLNEKPATTYTDHFNGLTFREVTDMIGNYESNQSAVINATMNINDARSCWFSLTALKSFIGHLEAEVANNKALSGNELGIRFYYGAHNNPATLAGIPANYAGLHNLILIPTYKAPTGINTDFDPYRVDSKTGQPYSFNLMGRPKAKNSFSLDDDTGISADSSNLSLFSMDHGDLFPPSK